jgi:hypothetical protein
MCATVGTHNVFEQNDKETAEAARIEEDRCRQHKQGERERHKQQAIQEQLERERHDLLERDRIERERCKHDFREQRE